MSIFVASSNARGLRGRLLVLLSATLTILFTIIFAFMAFRTYQLSEQQTHTAAKELAEVIGDAAASFGEIGDMDGLQIFVDNLAERDDLGQVHLIRSALTTEDFGEREGATPQDEIEKKVLDTGEAHEIPDAANHTFRYVFASRAEETCLGCHTGEVGSILGATSVTVRTADADNTRSSLILSLVWILVGALLIELVVFSWVLKHRVIKPVRAITENLSYGAESVESASIQVADSSQIIASGAAEQAASFEEIASSLEQVTAMTSQNVGNADQANEMASKTRVAAEQGNSAMNRLSEAMTRIQASSTETAKIIKTIDEIAFQTNLLALNAAVEAARAGEAGKGFAVVAEEVRHLAQRSAEAARNTSALIEEAQGNAKSGVGATEEVQKILSDIGENISEVTRLIEQVTTASREQAQGIEQVNGALSQMAQVTQDNASHSQQTASHSEEFAVQAEQLSNNIAELSRLIVGGRDHKTGSHPNADPSSAIPRQVAERRMHRPVALPKPE